MLLLSLLESREYVTEYSAPQWGQKKVSPSGMRPVRGMSIPPYTMGVGAVRLNHPRLDLVRSIALIDDVGQLSALSADRSGELIHCVLAVLFFS
jgi:hypothetical protein